MLRFPSYRQQYDMTSHTSSVFLQPTVTTFSFSHCLQPPPVTRCPASTYTLWKTGVPLPSSVYRQSAAASVSVCLSCQLCTALASTSTPCPINLPCSQPSPATSFSQLHLQTPPSAFANEFKQHTPLVVSWQSPAAPHSIIL